MPTLPDDSIVFNDHTPDRWIRLNIAQTAPRQFQRHPHIMDTAF
jgi:hypothetical protein